MSQNIRIESECLAENLDFPKHLDHVWLFIAAGIHERVYSKAADDRFVPRIADGFWTLNGGSKNMLAIGSGHSWSDGKPITSDEVSVALYRGVTAGIFSEVRVVGPSLVAIEMANDIQLSAELLSSAIFSVRGPSLRSTFARQESAPIMERSRHRKRRVDADRREY